MHEAQPPPRRQTSKLSEASFEARSPASRRELSSVKRDVLSFKDEVKLYFDVKVEQLTADFVGFSTIERSISRLPAKTTSVAFGVSRIRWASTRSEVPDLAPDRFPDYKTVKANRCSVCYVAPTRANLGPPRTNRILRAIGRFNRLAQFWAKARNGLRPVVIDDKIVLQSSHRRTVRFVRALRTIRGGLFLYPNAVMKPHSRTRIVAGKDAPVNTAEAKMAPVKVIRDGDVSGERLSPAFAASAPIQRVVQSLLQSTDGTTRYAKSFDAEDLAKVCSRGKASRRLRAQPNAGGVID